MNANVQKLHEADLSDDETVIDGTAEHVEETDDDMHNEAKAIPLKDTLLSTIKNEGYEKLEEFAKARLDEISELRDKRETQKNAVSMTTAQVTNLLDQLEQKGLNKKAVKAALAYLDMSDKERSAFDLTYKIARAIVGEPLQIDLFKE